MPGVPISVVSNTDNAHAVNIAYMPLSDPVKNSDSSPIHPGEPEVQHLQWVPKSRMMSLREEVALTSHPVLPSKAWSSEGFPTKTNYF